MDELHRKVSVDHDPLRFSEGGLFVSSDTDSIEVRRTSYAKRIQKIRR